MFKKKFIRLCNERGESPSAVCRKVNIAPATFSCWTDDSVPRQATLLRIAEYFGVPTDYFFTDNNEVLPETNSQPNINNVESSDIIVQIKKYLEEQKLSEGEIMWLKLYRQVSDDTRILFIKMMESFEQLPDERKKFAIQAIRFALGDHQ